MLFDQAIDMPEALQSDDLRVMLMDEYMRYSLRIKSKDVAAFKKTTGLKLPSKINAFANDKGTFCAKLGPDEWFVRAPIKSGAKLEKPLTKASKDFVCSVTEVSHRNVGFEISGPEAAALINVGCSLDLHADKFPIGKATRTAFESAGIILIRTDEHRFELECWRSFGPYLRDYFKRITNS